MLAAILIQGCETARVGFPPEEPASTEVAEQAERDGEFVIAAREYDRLARQVNPPQRQGFELRAVDALIKGGLIAEARRALDTIEVAGLDPSFRARTLILQARIQSAGGNHERAIRLLNDAQTTRNLSPALLADIHHARAQAETALDNPIGAVRNLIAREQYIVGPEAIADNQLQLWKILTSQTRDRLTAELNKTSDPVLSGWIELAIASIDHAGNPTALSVAVARWKKAYSAHPAGESLLNKLTSAAPGLIGRIDRIALLLPLSSRYAVAAQAVHDGFMAMAAVSTDPDKPTVTVYDFGEDPSRAPDYYRQAVLDGAQVVVGPLGREAADAIIRRGLTVPTLILSHTDEDAGEARRLLFQFGLPPEQEARQVAERAYLDGRRQAAVLYPGTTWGERMVAAFTAHWQRLGGIVLASESYIEDQADFSDPIRRLLNIVQSEERRRLLQEVLGQKLQFEPRPRHDIDFIFLAADARRGRLIKPQLNFFHAARVPVYATSHIYTGKGDPVHDLDLEGIRFADMPWMLLTDGRIQELRQQLQHDWPHAYSDLDRLYALGVDSYAILPYLNRIHAESGTRFRGVTSGLSLGPGGRLQRQLIWAQFRKGLPRLVDTFLKYDTPLGIVPAPGG